MRRTKETFQSFEDETSRVRASTKTKGSASSFDFSFVRPETTCLQPFEPGHSSTAHEKTLSVGRPGYCGNHVRRHPGARLAAGPDLRCGVFLRNEQ